MTTKIPWFYIWVCNQFPSCMITNLFWNLQRESCRTVSPFHQPSIYFITSFLQKVSETQEYFVGIIFRLFICNFTVSQYLILKIYIYLHILLRYKLLLLLQQYPWKQQTTTFFLFCIIPLFHSIPSLTPTPTTHLKTPVKLISLVI